MPKRFGRWFDCWNTQKAHETPPMPLPPMFLVVHLPSSSGPADPNRMEHG